MTYNQGCETKGPNRQFLSSFSVTTCMQPAGHERMIHWILLNEGTFILRLWGTILLCPAGFLYDETLPNYTKRKHP
jgi:hypothetical protein